MTKQKTNDFNNKELNLKYAKMILTAYTTGDFSILFPYMAEDYKHESYWVAEPMIGKATAIDYYIGKGATLRRDNEIKGQLVVISEKPKSVAVDKLYINNELRSGNNRVIVLGDAGKICVFFAQPVSRDEIVHTLAIPTIGEDGLLKSILITEPNLFNLEPFEENEA